MKKRITSTSKQPPAELLTRRVVADQVWAKDHSIELWQRYPNQWVAIHDQNVVAADSNRSRCVMLAQKCSAYPITLVHTCSPRVPGFTVGVVSPNPTDPPADYLRSLGQSVDARTLEDIIRDLRYRSVSFDLHGTLVCSRIGWNERIADAFRSVLTAHGFDDVFSRIDAQCGTLAAAVVTAIAKEHYTKIVYCTEFPEFGVEFYNPALAWPMANNYALDELVSLFGDPDCCPAVTNTAGSKFSPLVRRLIVRNERNPKHSTAYERREAVQWYPAVGRRDLSRALVLLRATQEHMDMGIAVHKCLSGSAPEDWEPTDEQRRIIDVMIECGLVCGILSNGSAVSVRACVERYFPQIPVWQIYTPDSFHHIGKPSSANAAMLLMSMGMAMVRNAIEGNPAPVAITNAVGNLLQNQSVDRLRSLWEKVRESANDELAKAGSRHPPRDMLAALCTTMYRVAKMLNLTEAARDAIIIMPHEHLHVGNSTYHDELPFLGLGLPFTCVKYDPSNTPTPTGQVRPQHALDLHPAPHFDDREDR